MTRLCLIAVFAALIACSKPEPPRVEPPRINHERWDKNFKAQLESGAVESFLKGGASDLSIPLGVCVIEFIEARVSQSEMQEIMKVSATARPLMSAAIEECVCRTVRDARAMLPLAAQVKLCGVKP